MNGLPEPLASENKNKNVGKTDQVLFLQLNLDMVASPISTTLICTLGIKVKKCPGAGKRPQQPWTNLGVRWVSNEEHFLFSKFHGFQMTSLYLTANFYRDQFV